MVRTTYTIVPTNDSPIIQETMNNVQITTGGKPPSKTITIGGHKSHKPGDKGMPRIDSLHREQGIILKKGNPHPKFQ